MIKKFLASVSFLITVGNFLLQKEEILYTRKKIKGNSFLVRVRAQWKSIKKICKVQTDGFNLFIVKK